MSLMRHSFFHVMSICHTCAFYVGSWLNWVQLILSLRNMEFDIFVKTCSCALGGTHLVDKSYLSLYITIFLCSVYTVLNTCK